MGSDAGVRAPTIDSTSARAKRHLAAARAARDGITTMVDALRISKPPRAPSKHTAGYSTVPAARRHALIPLAEGRLELEARIHALEDAVAARDTELLALKRRWARALIKRRNLENDREAARGEALSLKDAVHTSFAAAQADRKRLERVLEDVATPLSGLREVLSHRNETKFEMSEQLSEEITAVVEDIEEVSSTARDAMKMHPLPPGVPDLVQKSSAALAKIPSKSSKPRVARGSSSVVGSDEDAKSCASFASSAAFGEDRETQLDALVELIDILESKIAIGPVYPLAASTLARAKRAASAARPRSTAEVSELISERDRLQAQLDAVMAERETAGGEEAALALAAKAEAELREANEELETMRSRLAGFDRIAERVVKHDALASNNAALESELRSAKKTVERLIQERNSLRRTAHSSVVLSNTPSSSRFHPRGNSDAMRRILDWRQRASSENHGSDGSPHSGRENGVPNEHFPNIVRRADRVEALPDRPTGVIQGRGPVKKRRMGIPDTDGVNNSDAQSHSEQSLEVGVNDSVSAQSLPVQGFLRRHDSFLSAGNVSASGDEITITNHRNIFGTGAPTLDGLKILLGGS